MPFIPGFQSKPWAGISQRFERINCSTARHAEKPAGHVIDRHQQAIGFYQFVEDLRRCLRRPKGRSRRLAVARPVMAGADLSVCSFVSFTDEDGEANLIPADKVMLLESIHYENEFEEKVAREE